jgi:signal transduction histidine kinase/CheY-like chemotaxis protein
MKPIRLISTLLFLLLLSVPAASEGLDKDALFEVWLDKSNTDEVRLNAFYQVLSVDAAPPEESQMKRWFAAIDEALKLCESTANQQMQPRILTWLAFYQLYQLNDIKLVCATSEKALDLAILYEDYNSQLLLSGMYLKGLPCPNGKYHKEDVLILFNALEDKLMEEDIPLYLAIQAEVDSKNASYPETLNKLLKAIEAAKQNSAFDANLGYLLWKVGSMHLDVENYKEAKKYLEESIALSTKLNEPLLIGSGNVELSRIYINKKQSDTALQYLARAIDILTPPSGENAACESCLHIAYAYEAALNNIDEEYSLALEKLMKLANFYAVEDNLGNEYGHAFYHLELAVAYYGLGQLETALKEAETSLQFSGNLFLERKRAYEIIYQIQEELGNTPEAYQAFKNYVVTKDSMTVLLNAQEMTRMELENSFEQERLQSELAHKDSLSSERAKRHQLIAAVVLAILIAIGLFYRLKLVQKTKNLLNKKNLQIEAEKERAESSERAKHRFLANMSHEIRTPMNAITGMTEILLRRSPKKDQLKYLNGIKESSSSLLVIINDILDLSKIEAGKISFEHIPFSCAQVLENVQTIMQFKAEEKGLELSKSIPDNVPQLIGDPTRLHQVLVNLVGNAIKFTANGSVSASIQDITHQPDNKALVHFVVSDTGIGIDQERIEKVFESFEQAYADTSRKYGGTGLGLSISKKMVELQGGKIWVESEKGKGSHFHFTIPFAVSNAEEKPAAIPTDVHVEHLSNQLAGLRVLLVEDNSFNAIVAQEELEDFIPKVMIVVAANGKIALEKIAETDFDVVLMDVQMPVMNGYEATKVIRMLDCPIANIPIIAMTANVLKEEVKLCYDAGMNDFIGKPFETDVLLQKLVELTRNNNSQNQVS